MADFDQIRQQLRQTREVRDTASKAMSAAQEQLKRAAVRKAELDRVFNSANQAHVADRARILEEQRRAEADLQRQRRILASATASAAGLLQDFDRFSDPRQGIERFNDAIPILMMPVRLETRFKTISVREGARPVHQLWVRIYPDDCSIDSFDESLTESERANAEVYWTSMWQAGGIESQERAAWQLLASRHGSGRAAWIVQQFQPVNAAAKPAKPRAQDVILTIPVSTPLSGIEESATLEFWRSTWLADGRSGEVADAVIQFASAVGQSRAAEIEALYIPGNFNAPLLADATKQTVNVSVAFVVFPGVDTKRNAWSHAPKAVSLPDRFVFLGYETGTENPPTVEIGRHVPSPLLTGINPGAPTAEQIQHDAEGDLVMPDELKWISDFDRAIEVGMALRINLTPAQATNGFKRILVVGLRIAADEQVAKTELETLFRHHSFSKSGFAIVPQGTPTNNTEAAASGLGRLDSPDESFEDRKGPLFSIESGWLDKKDGQWLAEYLGIDPSLFLSTHHAGSTDQLTARAMNVALWPGTLGYWMETMMSSVFTRNGIENTREFFNRFVIAGGACPAIRIGAQPYGILPATAFSRMAWINQRKDRDNIHAVAVADPVADCVQQLYPVLRLIDADFRAIVPEISRVGADGDAHAMLLDIVGLHSGSVEWSQRYAESLKTFFNRLNMLGSGRIIDRIIASVKRMIAREKLRSLGYGGEKDPFILDLIFNGKHNRLKGGVIDDVPLSETQLIRAWTADNRNYIQYLIDAAGTSLDALYSQEGFKDNRHPTSLLYLLLRHSLQLGYHDVSIRLHESAGLYDSARAARARVDDPFLHIRTQSAVSESRYEPLYARNAEITGSSSLAVHEFIASRLQTLTFARYLREQVDAMHRLKVQPTARLERTFADHMDCCSYRLDAWISGFVNYQLSLMRNLRDGDSSPARQGIYIGAYAWLEDLKPEKKIRTPVRLSDPKLIKEFAAPGDPPLMRDNTNQGFVHAPSLNHAVAAAVLRNGFISCASGDNRQTMAVNLTSERVRTALRMIEGIRAGQSLADLLGYQFERGLHDRHGMAEVDRYIYKLRRAFPIRADRFASTRAPEGVSIEAIEARNVINGLSLVEHIKAVGIRTYPFGVISLPPVGSQAEADAINAEADRLLDSHDAVADLALSEGVYQAVLGNYDRVASTYDAYARGDFPPEPDVIRTPLNGIGLTHRFGLHLAAGSDPGVSPDPAIQMTPRAQAEPAVNRWLHDMLPPLAQIGCLVDLRDAASGVSVTREVTLNQLGLQPMDLVLLIADENQNAMMELDDRICHFAFLNFGARPDIPLKVRYMETQVARFSLFEVMPLTRSIRQITTKSRPLKATDLTLANQATTSSDLEPFIDKQRLDLVRAGLENLRDDFVAFRTMLDAQLADLTVHRPNILANTDSCVMSIADLLSRAATFSVPQAGWGFAFDFRRRTYAAILDQAAALVRRWDAKLAEFNERLAKAAAASTDGSRLNILAQAERTISTVVTSPLPATPALYLAHLTGVKQPALVAKRDQLNALSATTHTLLSVLLADAQALLPVTEFDSEEVSLVKHGDDMVRFAEDVSAVCAVVITELNRRLQVSADLFQKYMDSAAASAQVQSLENAAKAMLGEAFRIVPEFRFSVAQGDELENAMASSKSGELFLHLTSPPQSVDFPVDTWLYGVARVRDKVRAWEQTVMFTGALEVTEPELDAIQLPFLPGDRWLGLEFPEHQKLDTDRLLYTAHFATPFSKASSQCGLLIDEWIEILPTLSVDTGITFHHDRPNSEAPQTMLLVTPSEFRGTWRWNDLIDALNETLDMAKRRAIEPRHIDKLPYAPFLPATVVATQVSQLTIAVELALNNKISQATRV